MALRYAYAFSAPSRSARQGNLGFAAEADSPAYGGLPQSGRGARVVRGTPGEKRSRTVSTRLTDAEWLVWEAAREVSGRREMGAWVRALVEDVLVVHAPGERPGDVPRVPEVNAAAYAELTAAANNLNQLTRYAHQHGEIAAALQPAIQAVVEAAYAVRGVVATRGSSASRATSPPPAEEPGVPGLR